MIKTLSNATGILNAAENIAKYVQKTPLEKSELLSLVLEADVWLKKEFLSPIHSFKIRGALNHLLVAKQKRKVSAAVASSTGNHGQGVAYSCKLLGIPAHIFLPNNPNKLKLEKIIEIGAEVHISKDESLDFDDIKAEAKHFSKEHNFEFVDDGESLSLIEGTGTIGLEVAKDLPNVDLMFVPLGSGSLISGTAAGLKSLQPNAKVIAVSPEGSPAMVKSFFAKKSVEHSANSIADGIICRLPAELALNAILKFVDDAKLVSDNDILRAVHTLRLSDGIILEPSGAAPLAIAFLNKENVKGKRIVLILTGANILPEYLEQALHTKPFFIPDLVKNFS